MEIELAISSFLLLALTFLATVDMAFGQLSDVGLRLLAAAAEEVGDRHRVCVQKLAQDHGRLHVLAGLPAARWRL